mgnify:CR=1 FL=1|jgi:hypothetical protein
MKYKENDKVMYTPINGKKIEAIIIACKDKFETGSIKTKNASGNFDYLISIEKEGKTEQHFCQENDLE